MKKEKIVKIITALVASNNIDLDLVKLTEHLVKGKKCEWVGGVLGGEFGYGCNFKNKVFEMRPFYWGECDCGFEKKRDREYEKWSKKNQHAKDCYQTLVKKELIEKGWKKSKFIGLDAPKELTWDEQKKIEDRIRRKYCKKFRLSFPAGCAVHCTCDFEKRFMELTKRMGSHKPTCSLVLPNFKHYKSGLEIRWYKWIGRDMELNKRITNKEWKRVFRECIESIGQGVK